MNILYMGYFCNENIFNGLVSMGSNSSHARQQLETKLLDGMIDNLNEDTIEVISYLPEIKSIRSMVGESEKYREIEVRFLWCNKKSLISVLLTMRRNLSYIKSWTKKRGKRKKIILTYSVNPVHVIPALLLRKIGHYKIVSLCSEVSNFRRNEGVGLAEKVNRRISAFLDNSFDGYILLTKHMNEVVNKKNRPYLVMEGIAQEFPQISHLKKTSAIMYAGGLTEDNGIEILISGFIKMNRPDIKLWICGDGPLKERVVEYAKNYDNIFYFGIVPNGKVQKMEQEAAVLVAPRFSKYDFTKYSFPSKTIEYMSSGTPVLLTRLQGIPDEYFQYAYILEDETSEGICALLNKIFDDGIDFRNELGQKAQNYILTTKNRQVQAQKVINFLNDLQ